MVLEQTHDVSYSACGMPYNIADPQRDMEKLVVRKAEVFIEKNKINLLTGHRVMVIDRAAKKVSGIKIGGGSFAFDYDKLLIATGASPVRSDLPGFDLPQVMVLKSLEQGKKIKSYLEKNPIKKAVIIGMGYIALEMCEAFEKRGIKISMVKPKSVFLPWLSPDLADVIYQELIQKGVDIHSGVPIEKIEPLDNGVRVVCKNLTLEADLVLAAFGVKPCSEMARNAGLDLGILDSIAVALHNKMTVEDFSQTDLAYAPPFGPVWDPLLTAANQLVKKI